MGTCAKLLDETVADLSRRLLILFFIAEVNIGDPDRWA